MKKVHGLILIALGFLVAFFGLVHPAVFIFFGLPVGIIVVAVGIWIYRKASFSERLDALIISLLRSRSKITVDDIIVEARCSASEVMDRLNYLVSKAVVRSLIEQGRTYYVLA